MFNKSLAFSLLFLISFYALAQTTEPASEQAQARVQIQNSPSEHLPTDNSALNNALNNALDEAQILQSVDDISSILENEINKLDQHTQSHNHQGEFNDPADAVLHHTLKTNDSEISPQQTLQDIDNIDSIDSFDSLTLDDVLTTDIIEQQGNLTAPRNGTNLPFKNKPNNTTAFPPINDMINETINEAINNTKSDTITHSSKGVGVQGDEESTINNLDNSDLMDYLKDEDIWQKDLLDDGIDLE